MRPEGGKPRPEGDKPHPAGGKELRRAGQGMAPVDRQPSEHTEGVGLAGGWTVGGTAGPGLAGKQQHHPGTLSQLS